jgi:hypothetical protein
LLLLDQTRRSLYLILAGEPGTAGAPDGSPSEPDGSADLSG